MTIEARSIPVIERTSGATVSASRCSRELTCHDDQTVTEIEMYTFSSRHPGQRPRLTLRAGAIAARATGALTATTWTAVAT